MQPIAKYIGLPPDFHTRMKDFYRETLNRKDKTMGMQLDTDPDIPRKPWSSRKETRMNRKRIDTITFGCGCIAMPLDAAGTSWSLQHSAACVPAAPSPARKETPMNEPKYRQVSTEELVKLQIHLRAREDHLLKVKGHDYTRGGTDRMANFIEEGKALGISPEVVWAVYFHKHVTAIMTWATTGHLESEDLIDRFVDIRNYCLLGLALHDARLSDSSKEATKCPA